MVIKSCEMFSGMEEKALPAAAAVELIHNFSLIHDDIMDNDDIRHGISTVHKKFGLPIATNSLTDFTPSPCPTTSTSGVLAICAMPVKSLTGS